MRFLILRKLTLAAGALALFAGSAYASQLALQTLIQYPQVIQGGNENIFAYVYNYSPLGSPPGPYKVTGAYGPNYSTGFPIYYQDAKTADGGATYVPLPFVIGTSNIAPGNVPVSVTLQDTQTGNSLTLFNNFTVLAHAAPALVVNGNIVSLSSQSTMKFAAPVFAEASGGPEAASGAYSPEMLGDPPGEPTADLDLDSITAVGSPYITTTLAPFTDLLSNDDPSQGLPFSINFNVPSPGEYSTTFLLNYSDEQGLPGADAPGSQHTAFNVDIVVNTNQADWTITTDVVPEPATAALLACALAIGALAAKVRTT